MNDDITMSVYDGDVKQQLGDINGIGFVNNEFTYTAGTYFSRLKEMQSDPKLISLADAILDYGYFTQQLFNYNTGWLEEQTLNEDVSAEELQNELVAAKKELFNLRFQNATNQLDNTARIKEVRKNIARIQTVITEKSRA